MLKQKSLQLIQHVLATTHGISLRILREDAFTNAYNHLVQNDQFKALFPQAANFKSYLSHLFSDGLELSDLYSILTKFHWTINSKWIWRTLPSNPNPYHRRITQNTYIKTLYQLYHLNLSIASTSNKKNADIEILKCFTGLIEFVSYMPELKGVIVGGQFWELFEKKKKISEEIDSNMKRILSIQEKVGLETNLFNEKDLFILARERRAFSRDRLIEKGMSIMTIIEKISFFINREKEIATDFGRKEWIDLIHGVSFLCDQTTVDQIIKFFISPPAPFCDPTIKPEILIFQKINDDSAFAFTFLKEDANKFALSYVKPYIETEQYEDSSSHYKGEIFSIYGKGCVAQEINDFSRILDYSFSNFIESCYARTKAREAEHLLELQETLYNSSIESNELFKVIIEKAINFLIADTGSYMKYRASDRSLLLTSHPEDNNWKSAEKYKEEIIRWANSEKRNSSSSYRAIDEGKPIIIKDALSEDEKSRCIQIFENPVRSSLTVPVVFYERPLGVINIDGFTPRQFRWDDLVLLSALAKDIAPFIYEQNFLNNIVAITNTALSLDLSDRAKLDRICSFIIDIFCCAGASIWLRDDTNHNLYKLSASYKFECITPKDQKEYEYDINDRLLNGNKLFFSENIESSEAKILFKDNLLIQKYHSIMIAPILIPEETTPLGVLEIYDYQTKKEALQISKNLLEMIGKFLGIAVTTVKELHRGERQIIELTAHELGQALISIGNTTKRLRDNLDMTMRGSGKTNMILADLTNYIEDAEITLKSLTSEEAEKAVKRRTYPYDQVIKQITQGKKEDIDIYEEVKNIVYGATKKIREKKIKFKISGAQFMFHWYKAAVHRVLNNIIDNAIQYTGNELPYLLIEFWGDAYINEVVVTDLGLGISREESRKLFVKRYRTDTAKQVKPEGKGLGLFLAKTLAMMWGGRVYLKESERVPELSRTYKTSFAIVFPKNMGGKK